MTWFIMEMLVGVPKEYREQHGISLLWVLIYCTKTPYFMQID